IRESNSLSTSPPQCERKQHGWHQLAGGCAAWLANRRRKKAAKRPKKRLSVRRRLQNQESPQARNQNCLGQQALVFERKPEERGMNWKQSPVLVRHQQVLASGCCL